MGPKVQSILLGQAWSPMGVFEKFAGFLNGLHPDDAATTRILPLIYPADAVPLPNNPNNWLREDSNPIGGSYNVTNGRWIHLDLSRFSSYLSSIRSGALELQGQLIKATSSCPNQKTVITGYSQGAMAIQLALADLEARPGVGTGVIESGLIKGVMLLANPLQDPTNPIGTYLGTGSQRGMVTSLNDYSAVSSIGKMLLDFDMKASYPSSLHGVTASYCTNNDFLCSPDGATDDVMTKIHIGYPPASVKELGEWAAERYYE